MDPLSTEDLADAVIAVDGGGTSCRVALQAQDRIREATTGPANATTDFDGAVAAIGSGLARVAAETGLPVGSLAGLPAYLGVAGVVDAADADRLRAALPFTRARIEDDRRPAARGALGDRDGALAGLGTGSFFACQKAGHLRLAGGWGSRLRDFASGFWIGQEALARTLDAHDGLIEPSGLTEMLMARHGGKPSGIVAFSRHAAPQDFGALAPTVIDAAASGDHIAGGILKGGALYVADTLRLMGWRRGQPLCLVGGVGQHYAPYLPLDMEAWVVAPLGTTLDGALDFARQVRDGRD